ncbi:CAP domain-containing protein [Kitasatospora sp. NPDC056138]|uniref:CAP domain-containing protein n=1 Tax=Kitasatospora sp. NPDC056138 TaxID=3345724 RepID=UPI0035DFD400
MRNPTRAHHRATAVVAAALMSGGTMLATNASAAVSDVSPAEQQAIVSQTNSVRQEAGQPPLTWDSALAAEAQAWADDPASTAGGQLHHADINNAAENMSSSSPSQATGQWAGEKSTYDADPDHDYNSNPAGYQRWGHYYNMIQSNYRVVGCGSRSDVPTGSVTVCRYSG